MIVSINIHVHVYIIVNKDTYYTDIQVLYNMPSHNVYYANVHRDNWCDWKGEDSAAVLSLSTKFTVVTIHVYLTKILVV